MSENRIRKSAQVQPHGAGGAGVRVDTSVGSVFPLKYNPDGTERDVGPEIFTVTGITSSSSSAYFAVATVPMQLVAVRATLTVNGGSGAQFEVVKGAAGTAAGSGTVMSAAGALTGQTANTPFSVAPLTTSACRVAAGEQLGLKLGGTLTSLAGGVVTLHFRQI